MYEFLLGVFLEKERIKMIKLIIADDQLLFRSMLEEILIKDTDIQLAASCGSGDEAVEKTLEFIPDVVLLDIRMPGKSGIDALREIKTALPQTKIIMLTTFEDDKNVALACELGADGYLIKDLKPDVLIMSIKCIYNDMVLFHRSVYNTIQSSGMSQKASEKRIEIGDMIFDQIDVAIMKYISVGKSNKEIAQLLNYTEGTIKNKVSKILSTTGLSDRTGISIFAIKNQIV